MRYQRLLRKKNHERIMKQEQEHTKKLEKELKFADDLENAEDTETRCISLKNNHLRIFCVVFITAQFDVFNSLLP